jgi:hypothetical protein
LRDFVARDEKKPKMMLYPRDPSLDPQLVWEGKDEQDLRDLEVPVISLTALGCCATLNRWSFGVIPDPRGG